ncbi:hypothetical protein COO60DRAFT_664934 [Scenedesmus sp. NREL 46B-D3]|nr:hypothetical protein COO60DRAFT_664934 [Scenedesmus sp. NREL 46B-D3]
MWGRQNLRHGVKQLLQPCLFGVPVQVCSLAAGACLDCRPPAAAAAAVCAVLPTQGLQGLLHGCNGASCSAPFLALLCMFLGQLLFACSSRIRASAAAQQRSVDAALPVRTCCRVGGVWPGRVCRLGCSSAGAACTHNPSPCREHAAAARASQRSSALHFRHAAVPQLRLAVLLRRVCRHGDPVGACRRVCIHWFGLAWQCVQVPAFAVGMWMTLHCTCTVQSCT